MGHRYACCGRYLVVIYTLVVIVIYASAPCMPSHPMIIDRQLGVTAQRYAGSDGGLEYEKQIQKRQ